MSVLHHNHPHHVSLSRYPSLSFIVSGRSSRLHLSPFFFFLFSYLSAQGCCIFVLAGRPTFGRPWVGVHRSKSLMSSSLLLQQCPTCLVRLTLRNFLMGSRWPYSYCFVGCCFSGLFNTARSWNHLTGCKWWVMLNRIMSVQSQYLKLFDCVQKLNYCWNIAMLGTIRLCTKELLKRIYCV